MAYLFKLSDKVRDYECDIQGIVNNSVYQNYLEHTRHEFLLESGVDFTGLAHKSIHLVVSRVELDYKSPLKSGDRFWIGLNIRRASKVRMEFLQDIYRESDDKLVLKGITTGVCLNERGRPFVLPELAVLFEEEES